MTWCQDAINSLFSILKTTELVDVFDILVLSYLVYWVIKLVRETRAGQLMKGIVLLFIAYIIAKFLQMKVVFLPDGAGIQHWRDCPDDYVPAGTAASIGKGGE